MSDPPQRGLPGLAGIRKLVSLYEVGRRDPTLAAAAAIAEALGVSLDELAGRESPPSHAPPEVVELLVELEQTIQRLTRALGGVGNGGSSRGAA